MFKQERWDRGFARRPIDHKSAFPWAAAHSGLSDSPLLGLEILNFFALDARDGRGPVLDAFWAAGGCSSLTLGAIATLGRLALA